MENEESGRPIWYKGGKAEDWVTRFTVGDDPFWDTMLLPFDATASIAHARGLEKAGVLTAGERSDLERELIRIRDEAPEVRTEDEDCHTVIERLLTERLGDVGKKIHTGRSRNDQVLAALRLWIRDRMDTATKQVVALVRALADLADRTSDLVMPGYTHLQQAMPSTAAMWALGYAENLCDDLSALVNARSLANASPLGSAAGYGVPYLQLDPAEIARQLGFERVQENVTAVQLSRGKLELHICHALLQTAITLNRMASDCSLFASAEFGLIRMPEAFTTGSSIMPQKRNPDVAELARATMHRVAAEMQVLIQVPANLPSGYHRDLQLTKEAVMRAILRTEDLLSAMNALVVGIEFDGERARRLCGNELYATAAAMRRVSEGVPFRTAYIEAARDREAWAEEAKKPISEVYRYPGTPGQTSSAGVRERAAALLSRCKPS